MGSVTLRNRLLMGSMHTGLEDRKKDIPKLAAYFAERAKGGVGLMVTGGYSPNREGWLYPFASKMTAKREARRHQEVTAAVHAHDARICLQLLHAGRYSYHPLSVSASKTKAPINRFTARRLSERGIERQIRGFVRGARLAREAGYDGIEVMASEGYFINQFTCLRTNHRDDRWGGSIENRCRLPVDIIRRIRAEVGDDFIIIYRLSMLDLVEGGNTWDEILYQGQAVVDAGASIINTGIGWHEARVPTIVTSVPRAAFTFVSKRFRESVDVPVVTTNRINTPAVAEQVLAEGHADMVSMARPLLADPDFMAKARAGRAEDINICIACNQACLDHTFELKRASCLVNPRACHETERVPEPLLQPKRLAVVGAGPAGLAFSVEAARRGHRVTLFEKTGQVGGQFNLARRIPGKEEFQGSLDYYRRQLDRYGVELLLKTEATTESLADDFDEVIIATGVSPRIPDIPGIDGPNVHGYADVVSGRVDIGERVALIGAGGIGFDVAEYLVTRPGPSPTLNPELWFEEWGVDTSLESRGAVEGVEPDPTPPQRRIWLLQRKEEKLGKRLGKTSGWVHRATLKHKQVQMLGGVSYQQIDHQGLHIIRNDVPELIEVDDVVICAGQIPLRELAEQISDTGIPVHLIGGADVAAELDAKRAIRQATELAFTI